MTPLTAQSEFEQWAKIIRKISWRVDRAEADKIIKAIAPLILAAGKRQGLEMAQSHVNAAFDEAIAAPKDKKATFMERLERTSVTFQLANVSNELQSELKALTVKESK